MDLKDRVVVITGAGSGIGRASALEFAREGARVVVADVNGAGAQETVELIAKLGGQGLAVPTDVANPDSVRHLVEATLAACQQVHVLFNNAAIQVNKTVEDTTVEEWNREIAVNLGGVFLCSKFFLPHLRTTKGCIINMASVNGFFVEPACAGYCATKGAIIALTKAMAIDHGKERRARRRGKTPRLMENRQTQGSWAPRGFSRERRRFLHHRIFGGGGWRLRFWSPTTELSLLLICRRKRLRRLRGRVGALRTP